MKKTLLCAALVAALASACSTPAPQSDVQALRTAAQHVADPYQRGLAEGWLDIAVRQDSHVALASNVFNDAGTKAYNNARHFVDGSVPFQPIYHAKYVPTRDNWRAALLEIETVNQRATVSPCRGEDAGRLAALTDEAWKEQEETVGTRWVHGWDAIANAQKLAQQVNAELARCVPPPVAPPPVQKGEPPLALSADAVFNFDSAVVTAQGVRQLDLLAQAITESKRNVQVLGITGYTDRFGSDAHNFDLSKRRAQAVAQGLKQRGVVAGRVDLKGMGAANPVKSCPGSRPTADVVACLAPNRRVEITTK
ncbi:OmpA family protein [Paraburkholderia sp. J67]|uniref:OmpA family protein n=1 Tax=Paraburkholderia sp. J67 TaxID=2805435 RepID=UPI002ABE7273|nr:OmpA family protein [Paraburkholderia sp. J67]